MPIITNNIRILKGGFFNTRMLGALAFYLLYCGFNTKSTDAQGELKPRSVIMREEGELGFLIIPRAQPTPE